MSSIYYVFKCPEWTHYAGKSMPELISELIWVPIGAKEDADMTLDHFRTPIYNGGMCATLQGTLRRNLPFNAYQQYHQRL